MNDINQIKICKDGNETIEKIRAADNLFIEESEICKFALFYAVNKKLKHKEAYSGQPKYGVATFDKEGISKTIKILFPENAEKPFLKMESLINAGLIDIGKELDKNSNALRAMILEFCENILK